MTLIHRMTGTPTWTSWKAMKTRCCNTNAANYARYGGRGIKVCDRWLSFENFYADMGERPIGTSLDRINNNGDYCPENCRWTSCKEQSRNTRYNRTLTYNGETKCLSEWAEYAGISLPVLRHRLKKGWTVEQSIETPIDTRKSHKLAKGNVK